jgi:hypothetical protein
MLRIGIERRVRTVYIPTAVKAVIGITDRAVYTGNVYRTPICVILPVFFP